MPDNNSFADLVLDQERLLRAFEDNAEVLVPAGPQRDAVASNLSQLHATKGRQDSFAAQRQETTQELGALMHKTREDARRLRALVRGLLGTRNERLVQFQVAPNRTRVRAAPKPPPPPLPE
jgi:3-methyladenine DNA glycosylase AlkC